MNNKIVRAADAILKAHGTSAAIDFLLGQLDAAVQLMPKTKQTQFISSLEREVGEQVTVTVINILSGKECEIRWDLKGTCCDPSTERYHTM